MRGPRTELLIEQENLWVTVVNSRESRTQFSDSPVYSYEGQQERHDRHQTTGGHDLSASNSDYDTFVAPIRHRMVNSVWRILRDADDTEDTVQEALLQILRKIRRIRGHPNPTALILRICVNLAIDRRRKRVNERGIIENADVDRIVDQRSLTPDQTVARQEHQTRVLTALGELPKRQAEAIVLHALEELPYAAMAVAMNCRESTARVLVSKARRRLRQQFGLSDNPTPQTTEVSTS